MEVKSISDWLRECLYIRRNAAWQGMAGTYRFLQIKNAVMRHCGMTEDGFWGHLNRLQKYNRQ